MEYFLLGISITASVVILLLDLVPAVLLAVGLLWEFVSSIPKMTGWNLTQIGVVGIYVIIITAAIFWVADSVIWGGVPIHTRMWIERRIKDIAFWAAYTMISLGLIAVGGVLMFTPPQHLPDYPILSIKAIGPLFTPVRCVGAVVAIFTLMLWRKVNPSCHVRAWLASR